MKVRAVVSVLFSGVVVAACSFPTVQVVTGDGGGGGADGGADGTTDASGDAPIDHGDAAADGADPCDKDGDGFPAKGACGGSDCDDNDKFANPGVSTFLTRDATGSPVHGDWNCDGKVEVQFKTGVSCGGLGVAGCAGVEGFTADPGCGGRAQYVYCKVNGLACEIDGTRTKQDYQGCK